jgi:hypothetical protein
MKRREFITLLGGAFSLFLCEHGACVPMPKNANPTSSQEH